MQYLLTGVARLTDDPALQPAAQAQIGTEETAVQRADKALSRIDSPPTLDAENPRSLDATWRGPGDEQAYYRAALATGDKSYVSKLLSELACEFERWRFLLTEAEPMTDRVPVPGTTILRHMFLGGDCAGKSNVPGLAVSWEGGGTDYAAFVLQASDQGLKALVYSFSPDPLRMTARPWRLVHGRYAWSLGYDADGDDEPDGTTEGGELELTRYSPVPFTMAPGKVGVLRLRLLERLAPLEGCPDLAIARRDVVRTGPETVRVTVHNVGPGEARNVQVQLLVKPDEVVASATIERLEAPVDLQPRVASVGLKALALAAVAADAPMPFLVRIDPGGAIAEVCESNNEVDLGVGLPGQFTQLRPVR